MFFLKFLYRYGATTAHASERRFSKMTFHVESCRPAKLEKHCVITSLMGGCEKLANVCIKMFWGYQLRRSWVKTSVSKTYSASIIRVSRALNNKFNKTLVYFRVIKCLQKHIHDLQILLLNMFYEYLLISPWNYRLEDGQSTFLRNAGIHQPVHMTPKPRRI